MGDLLFTDVVCLLSYLGLYTADKGYYSIYKSAFGQKWDFPASFPLASRSFPRRAPVSRESGQFSFSKLFFSTNHCTARGIVSTSDPWISTKSAAVSLFMLRFARNSELKLLSPSPFEPRGRFWVLFVRLFVILDRAKLAISIDFDFLSLSFRLIFEKFCYKARETLKILKKLPILWKFSFDKLAKNWSNSPNPFC